jgi:uncharacterized MAPEG superfamily protein
VIGTGFGRYTVAYWCVLLAVLLPIGCAWLAKWPGMRKPRAEGGFDNADPRRWLAGQEGWSARANAAQANSFEALPFFIAAVVIAHQLGAPQTRLDILAVLFITLRIIYVAMYVADLPRARSVIWALAFAVNFFIFVSAWR